MRIARFLDPRGKTRHGLLHSDGRAQLIEGDLFDELTATDEFADVAKLLYPLTPTAIIGIGANYRQLFEDKPLPSYPIVFYKGLNSLQHPGDPIDLPRRPIASEHVKFEGELAVIIGKRGKNIAPDEAFDHIFGYTIANDVSGTDWQGERVGMQWCKGKSFDTFCPLGPAIVTKDEIPRPEDLRLITRIDGQVEQNESLSSLCFSLPEIIYFLSAGQTLEPGTVILTGSPKGARFLKPGETTEITIEGIGKLSNPCRLGD